MFDRPIFWLVNLFAYLRHPRNIILFRRMVGYFPDVAMPRRYSEKMLWRKVFDHNPLFVTFSDKLATKVLLAERCPDLGIAAVLWTGRDASDIPQDLFAQPVIIKANHGSGFNFVCSKKRAPEALQVNRINGWLDWPFGEHQFEWGYINVKRKLFAEEFVAPSPHHRVIDISVHAVDGRALFIEVIRANKSDQQQKGYFDPDGIRWTAIEKTRADARQNPPLPDDFEIPGTFRKALDHTNQLSTGVDYARFDFLSVENRLYGGEITVYPASGLTRHAQFINYNKLLSEHWDLLKSWFLTSRQSWLLQVYADALRRRLIRETERG